MGMVLNYNLKEFKIVRKLDYLEEKIGNCLECWVLWEIVHKMIYYNEFGFDLSSNLINYMDKKN